MILPCFEAVHAPNVILDSSLPSLPASSAICWSPGNQEQGEIMKKECVYKRLLDVKMFYLFSISTRKTLIIKYVYWKLRVENIPKVTWFWHAFPPLPLVARLRLLWLAWGDSNYCINGILLYQPSSVDIWNRIWKRFYIEISLMKCHSSSSLILVIF